MSDNGIVCLMHIINNRTYKAQKYCLAKAQACVVQSAQNLTEITLAFIVGVRKRRD